MNALVHQALNVWPCVNVEPALQKPVPAGYWMSRSLDPNSLRKRNEKGRPEGERAWAWLCCRQIPQREGGLGCGLELRQARQPSAPAFPAESLDRVVTHQPSVLVLYTNTQGGVGILPLGRPATGGGEFRALSDEIQEWVGSLPTARGTADSFVTKTQTVRFLGRSNMDAVVLC